MKNVQLTTKYIVNMYMYSYIYYRNNLISEFIQKYTGVNTLKSSV